MKAGRVNQVRVPSGEEKPESGELVGSATVSSQVRRLRLRYALPGGSHWYANRIEKSITAYSSWLGRLSGDGLVREARLWTSGLLCRLPASIATGMLVVEAPATGLAERAWCR